MTGEYFIFEGKKISMDYYCVKDEEKIHKAIRNSYKENGFRNYPHFQTWLREKYTGDLPKEVYQLAQTFKFPNHIVELFILSEREYRKKYPDVIKSLFEDLPFDEKVRRFYGTDGGGRNIFEYEQDVLVGNLFERMIVHHSNINGVPVFRVNEDASNMSVTNTKPDLIYEIKFHEKQISIPVEVKTRFSSIITDKDLYVKMRGSSKTVTEEGGMIVSVFLNTEGFQTVIIDMSSHPEVIKTVMENSIKKCDSIPFNRKDLFNCKFWDENEMKKLLNSIYWLYQKRK